MKKKLLAGLMALTMLFSNGLCVAMAAESREEVAPEYGVVESSEKEHILETFDNIKKIVEKAEALGFSVKNAEVNTAFAGCMIVGPTEEEFSEVVAKAIEDGEVSHIDGETVMNAASVQLKCTLDGQQITLLCGDASPSYLHNLDTYHIIQLPHHGKLNNAKEIFNILKSPYSKQFLVSDNTGSGATSGGSDALSETFPFSPTRLSSPADRWSTASPASPTPHSFLPP